jgi:hypothetical protein
MYFAAVLHMTQLAPGSSSPLLTGESASSCKQIPVPLAAIVTAVTALKFHRRVLPEKPVVVQLLNKFPASHGTWRFIAMYIGARPPVPVVSYMNPVQNFTPYYLSSD